MAIYSSLIYLENIVIFHSYVNLPEANDWIGDVSINLLVGYKPIHNWAATPKNGLVSH
jgi:hypothetical protein